MKLRNTFFLQRGARWGAALGCALLLAACGGGGTSSVDVQTPDVAAATPAQASPGFGGSPQAVQALAAAAPGSSVDVAADDPAILAATAGTGTAITPKIAVNADGVGQAVWAQFDGDSYGIFSNRYLPGVGWGSPVRIDNDTGGAADPQVVISNNEDRAVVVWRTLSGVGVKSRVFTRASDKEGFWNGQIIQLSSGNPSLGDALNPQMVMIGQFNWTIVWSQYNGPLAPGVRGDIWSATCEFASNGSYHCGSPVLAENNDIGTASNPEIVGNDFGLLIVVWEQSKGGKTEIWANTSFFGGYTWSSTPTKISNNSSGVAHSPHIAANGDASEAVVVWQQEGVWANRILNGTVWAVPQLVGNFNFQNSGQPKIALDASGKGAVVWPQTDGSFASIWARPYLGGGAWGNIELVEANNSGHAFKPQIAVASTPGSYPIVVWGELNGTRADIWASQKLPGAGWSAAQLIETDNTFGAMDADIAVDSSGRAIALWRQSDGTRDNIVANLYTPASKLGGQWGVPQLIEFFNGLVNNARASLLPLLQKQ
jgi:hypothetical protein